MNLIRKILIVILCVLVTALGGAAAEGGGQSDWLERPAVYTAKSNLEFHLRPEPASERWIGTVPVHTRVDVLEWREDWSLLRYNGAAGYAETRWLREFMVVDPTDPKHAMLPGFVPCTGLWTFAKETRIEAEGFPGMTAAAGTVAAVREEDGRYRLPVWRSETEADPASGTYAPFVPWEEAQPGDLIAGFSTFFHPACGAPLARERAHNIALGCTLMNDLVLAPGESFSFNGTCGPYHKKTGYLTARNISDSGYGRGGGVCQVSTTLYNALLELPIRITDWAVHSITGVQYVPQGYDSCVGRYTDLCFENTLPWPVRLAALPQEGAPTVLIYRAE